MIMALSPKSGRLGTVTHSYRFSLRCDSNEMSYIEGFARSCCTLGNRAGGGARLQRACVTSYLPTGSTGTPWDASALSTATLYEDKQEPTTCIQAN